MDYKNLLVKKVQVEYDKFINGIVARQLEEPTNMVALDKAYEKVCKENIVDIVCNHETYLTDLSDEQAEALCDCYDTLDYLYANWLDTDTDELEEIRDSIKDAAESLS